MSLSLGKRVRWGKCVSELAHMTLWNNVYFYECILYFTISGRRNSKSGLSSAQTNMATNITRTTRTSMVSHWGLIKIVSNRILNYARNSKIVHKEMRRAVFVEVNCSNAPPPDYYAHYYWLLNWLLLIYWLLNNMLSLSPISLYLTEGWETEVGTLAINY
jgi:hypothetical protein